MQEDGTRGAARRVDPGVEDVQDWPPRTRADDVREQLDREVGTLGVSSSADSPAIGATMRRGDTAAGGDAAGAADPGAEEAER